MNDFVYYFVNGNPVRTHPSNSVTDFKFHIAEMIHLNICKKTEVCRFFDVSKDMVTRACKLYKEEGVAGFYKERIRQKSDSQMLPEDLQKIQQALDKGESNLSIAKRSSISEGTIRYNIKIGRLKKKL